MLTVLFEKIQLNQAYIVHVQYGRKNDYSTRKAAYRVQYNREQNGLSVLICVDHIISASGITNYILHVVRRRGAASKFSRSLRTCSLRLHRQQNRRLKDVGASWSACRWMDRHGIILRNPNTVSGCRHSFWNLGVVRDIPNSTSDSPLAHSLLLANVQSAFDHHSETGRSANGCPRVFKRLRCEVEDVRAFSGGKTKSFSDVGGFCWNERRKNDVRGDS